MASKKDKSSIDGILAGLGKLLGPSPGKAAAGSLGGAPGGVGKPAAPKVAERKQFRTTVNSVIVGFDTKALKQLRAMLDGTIKEEKPGEEQPGEVKKPSWWKKLIGPALMILGGLAAFIYGLMTDGPLKGLMKLLAKGGIMGGLKWLGSVIGKKIKAIKTALKGFLKLAGLENMFKVVKDKVTKAFEPIAKVFKETIPNFFKKMFKPITSLFKATKGGFLKTIFAFIAKWGGNALKLLKPIPVIGSLISFAFAYSRFKSGDMTGGVLEIASGIASLFPGVGTVISIGIDILLAVLDYTAGGTPAGGGKGKGGILKEWGLKILEYVLKVPPFLFIHMFYKGIKTVVEGGTITDGLLEMAYMVPFLGTVAGWFGGPTSLEEAKADIGTKDGFFASIKNFIMDMYPIKNLVQFGTGIGKLFGGDFIGGLSDMAYSVPFFGSLVSFFGGPATAAEASEQIATDGGGFFKTFKDGALRKVLKWLPKTILGVSVRSRVAKWLGIDMSEPPLAQQQEVAAEKSIDQGSKSISDAGKKIAEASGKFGKSSPGVWEILAKASKAMSSNIFKTIRAGRTFVDTIYQGLLKITKEMAKKFKQMSQPSFADKASGFMAGQFRGMIPGRKAKTPMPTESWVRGPMPETLVKAGQPLAVKVVEPVQLKSDKEAPSMESLIGYSKSMNEKLFPGLIGALGEDGPICQRLDAVNSSIKNIQMPSPGGARNVHTSGPTAGRQFHHP